ncbi:DUF2142 domain-containing protein [Jiangella rhizosphaerae]|uniref:DUF2142 domain-containing protein n=1 Tax=Jiangella rhizosphaerae TaxID=2293569 RepID=A0A418KJD2_9ACTN|nr:DUF2142 domain-containing protein [Jiangella rhizosphaerae]RIQ14495.1 DUF2142 domain-containing protein [Jiangella rhizosphaerae]
MREAAGYRIALAAITLLVVTVADCWAVLTPAFRAPDEPQHVNSVLRLAYGGGWPAPGEALMSPAIDGARRQAALESDLPWPHGNRRDVVQYTDVAPVPDDERLVVNADNALPAPGTGASLDTVDQMTQHPPLYYAAAAAWLRVTGTADARWDHVLLSLRLFDVLLFVPLPLLAAAAARTLLGDRAEARPAGLVAAAAVLFVPMSAHILSAVTNDALVTVSGAVVTWLVARVLTGDLRWRTAAGLGVALGIGLLTKVMAAFAVPMVVVAYVLAAGLRRPWWPRVSRLLVVGTVAFAAGGWWWLRNLLVLGVVQPVGIPERWEPVPNAGLGHFVTTVVTAVTRSFVGDFGWLELRVPPAVYWSGAAVVAAVSVAALVRRDSRRPAGVLLLLPAALWCSVVANAWRHYVETGWITAVQGRYLFAGLAALAAVAALGIRPRAATVPWIVAGAGAVAAAALLFAFRGMYWASQESAFDAAARLAGWSPLSSGQLVAVGALTCVAGAAAGGACVRFAVVVSTSRAVTMTAAPASAASTTDGTGASV